MKIRVADSGGYQIVSVSGDIAAADLTGLRDELLRLLHANGPRMVLDLSPILELREELGPMMAFVLAATCRRAILLGGWLRLVCQASWRALLHEASIGDVIECYDEINAAVTARRGRTDLSRLAPHLAVPRAASATAA
jgi:hypothetical protein